MRRFLGALVFGLVITAPSLAMALPRVCLAELPRWLAREQRIPVGCEVIDCCPNCPADARIDWRVNLAGEAIGGAQITVQGVDTRHSLRPGETRLASIGSAHAAEPSLLATLRLEPDMAVLKRWAASPGTGEPLGEVSVGIAQLVGDEVVNQFSRGAIVVYCGSAAPPACDEIVLQGNLDGDEAVLQIDARRQPGSGCVDDEVHRAAATLPAGNLLASSGCRSEVGVYSSANAMAMHEGVTAWTDGCGDSLPVALSPILELPATFFLAIPDWLSQQEWGKPTEAVAREDLANAKQIYDENKTGISFGIDVRTLTVVEAGSLLALLPKAIVSGLMTGVDPGTFVCSLPGQLQALGLYVPKRLNVYYLPVPGTGMECPDDPNVVFIALNEKPETLAHEIGHGLSLFGDWGHTNTAPGFDSSNLMWVRSSDVRDHISLGQAFRMNLESRSVLNRNQVRTGPTRSCPAEPPPYPDPTACPQLDLDWARP